MGLNTPWVSGKPVCSETLADGRSRHTLIDGRIMTVSAAPTYCLEYLSTWVGAEEGETYPVNIAIAGLSSVEDFFEVWNFDIGEVRNYWFEKTVRITHLETGETFTGEELAAALRAQVDS
jgi:hypothetical protein